MLFVEELKALLLRIEGFVEGDGGYVCEDVGGLQSELNGISYPSPNCEGGGRGGVAQCEKEVSEGGVRPMSEILFSYGIDDIFDEGYWKDVEGDSMICHV